MDSSVAEFQLDTQVNPDPLTTAIAPGETAWIAAPPVPPDAIDAGIHWLLQGHPDQAHATWWTAIAGYTLEQTDAWMAELEQALHREARQQRQGGSLHQSLLLYQYWVEINDSAPAHTELGELLALLGRLDDAIAQWQQAIQQRPGLTEAHRALGTVFQRLQRWDGAIASYTQVLAHHPTDQDTHYRLAQCFMQNQQWDGAIAHLVPLRSHPDWPGVALDMAYVRLRQGRCDEAIGHLRRWAQFSPGVINPYLTWISTLSSHHYNNGAIAANAELLWMAQRPSANADLLFIVGKLLAHQGQPEAALQAFQTVLRHASSVELPPDSLGGEQGLPRLYPLREVQLEIVRVLLALRRYDEAIALAQRVSLGQGNAPQGHLELANALAAVQRWDDARQHYQQALHLAPRGMDAWLGLTITHLALGDWQAARESAQQALALDSNEGNACYYAGRACWEQGDLDGAIAYIRQALRLKSTLAPAIQRWLKSAPAWMDGMEQSRLQPIQPIQPPARIEESALGWQGRSPAAGTVIPLYPEQHIPLTPPKSLDPSPHFSFRFGDGVQLPAPCVADLPNGRFWMAEDQSSSAVMTATDDILRDLSPEFPLLSPGHPDHQGHTHRLRTVEAMEPIKHLPGRAVVLTGLANDMYFHWMTDLLPKVDLLQRAGIDLEHIDHFIVRCDLPFQRQTLEWLNIPSDRWVDIQDWHHLQADRLIVPSSAGAIAWMTPEALQFLRTQLLQRASSPPPRGYEKLYISRSQTANRRVVNEPTLVRYLQTFGFQAVHLESLSVADQIALFAQARVVVSPHGSGLTNSLFCQPGTQIIELFSPNFVYPCYWYLANLAQLDYHYLIGDRPFGHGFHSLLYANSRTEDLFISEHQLMALLAIAQAI